MFLSTFFSLSSSKSKSQNESNTQTESNNAKNLSSTAIKTTDDKQIILKELKEFISNSVENMIKKEFGIHLGITCDNCGQSNFRDYRYKCFKCVDYDLCGRCFEKKLISLNHKLNHPMILIMDPMDRTLSKLFEQLANIDFQMVYDHWPCIQFPDIKCNFCDKEICKVRFKCDNCIDYDLCWECFKEQKANQSHSNEHQIIINLFPTNEEINFDEIQYIEKNIGKGCFGAVSKVKYKGEKRALKEIIVPKYAVNETLMMTFENELKAYRELKSIHLVRYFGSSIKLKQDGFHFYLLLEFMEGGCLAKIIQKKEDQSLRRKFQWIQEIAEGLERIHQKGFVHKDIKPDNILINDFAEAKIADMGIVIHHEGKNYFDSFIGPVSYCAPEILKGQKFTNKVDIFSFGLLINALLTYEIHDIPSYVLTVMLLNKVSMDIFSKKSDILSELIEACINIDPEKRPTASIINEKISKFLQFFNENLPINFREYIKLPTKEKDEIFRLIYFKKLGQKIVQNFQIQLQSIIEAILCKGKRCRRCNHYTYNN